MSLCHHFDSLFFNQALSDTLVKLILRMDCGSVLNYEMLVGVMMEVYKDAVTFPASQVMALWCDRANCQSKESMVQDC